MKEVKCRFNDAGCTSTAVEIVEFEKGCVCYPDIIQALCAQHLSTAEPIKGMRVIKHYQRIEE